MSLEQSLKLSENNFENINDKLKQLNFDVLKDEAIKILEEQLEKAIKEKDEIYELYCEIQKNENLKKYLNNEEYYKATITSLEIRINELLK